MPLITGRGSWQEHPVYIQYDGNASRGNIQRCAVWKGYKYIVDIFKDECFYELYDLAADRQETENLLFTQELSDREKYWGIAAELDGLLRGHMREIQDYLSVREPDFPEFVRNYSH